MRGAGNIKRCLPRPGACDTLARTCHWCKQGPPIAAFGGSIVAVRSRQKMFCSRARGCIRIGLSEGMPCTSLLVTLDRDGKVAVQGRGVAGACAFDGRAMARQTRRGEASPWRMWDGRVTPGLGCPRGHRPGVSCHPRLAHSGQR